MLVPEISLTPQLEARFREAFPQTRLALLHSGLQDIARTSAWLEAARGDAGIVLGTRLGVLAPIAAPRPGGGRRGARHFLQAAGGPALLGARRGDLPRQARRLPGGARLGDAVARVLAEPPRAGRYEKLDLPERAVPGARLPLVRLIDLQREAPQQGLAPSLIAAIGERLAKKRAKPGLHQPARLRPGARLRGLRLGRRLRALHRADGPARRRRGALRCHHCGAESPIPAACPTCGNVDLRPMGRGTQRVEETLPPLSRLRASCASTATARRRRDELARTLEGIRRGEGDILVGTQLLAKGHDFPKLTLVGVLNADAALVSTDYRSGERLFSVLAQVAGRAGRHEQPGEVLLQTRYPGHPLYAALMRHDYAGFAESQLAERRDAGFPPFVFEAALRAEAKKLETAMRFLAEAAALVEAPAEVRVYDPVPHLITRRAGYERARLLMQSSSRPALQEFLGNLTERAVRGPPRDIRWHLDVDPIEFD